MRSRNVAGANGEEVSARRVCADLVVDPLGHQLIAAVEEKRGESLVWLPIARQASDQVLVDRLLVPAQVELDQPVGRVHAAGLVVFQVIEGRTQPPDVLLGREALEDRDLLAHGLQRVEPHALLLGESDQVVVETGVTAACVDRLEGGQPLCQRPWLVALEAAQCEALGSEVEVEPLPQIGGDQGVERLARSQRHLLPRRSASVHVQRDLGVERPALCDGLAHRIRQVEHPTVSDVDRAVEV